MLFAMGDLASLERQLVECAACPRLVDWREQTALARRAAFADETYWGRPVPGFGDPDAQIVVMGLAPAAHGANRTGRMFTGDRSGEWLYRALWRAGLANQPTSTSRDDGLRLKGAYVTSAVRCAPPANKPTADEREQCQHWLSEELRLLHRGRVIVALGSFAADATARLFGVRPLPRFGHGLEHEWEADSASPWPGRSVQMVCSYHPSQQNTFTGRLTEEMLDAVFVQACALVG